MADDDKDDTGSTGGKTFTQAEVDRLVRDRLARERSKFADYDDLKKAAEDAKGDKTQLEKLTEQIGALTTRAEKAEAETLRADVARELGLTARQARRLSGKTRDELLADGKDMLDDFDPKGDKAKSSKQDGDDGDGTGNGDDDGSAEDSDTDTGGGRQQQAAATDRGRGRPRENLRSGAPATVRKPVETDPLKLAEMIPRL